MGGLGLGGRLAGGGQALFEQENPRVVAGVAVRLLGGAREQRLIALELVDRKLEAGLLAQLGAERAG